MYNFSTKYAYFIFMLVVCTFIHTLSIAEPGTPLPSFPSAGWHRGNVFSAQENSRRAISKALESNAPNIEVDIIDFIDASGQRIGLMAHDYDMARIAGVQGKCSDYHDVRIIPSNSANPDLSPEPYMTVVELFDLIKKKETRRNDAHCLVRYERRGKAWKSIWTMDRQIDS